jgi:hypothetical protein
VVETPLQTADVPVIAPGCAGIDVTDKIPVLGVLEPQVLLAVTEIVPPPEPGITVIDVDVELPLQPDGSVQVYEVALATDEIL